MKNTEYPNTTSYAALFLYIVRVRLDEVCTKLITTGTVVSQTLQGIMRISPGELAAIPNLSGTIRKVYTPQEQFELFGAILLKCNSHSLASNKAVLTVVRQVN